MNDAEPVLAYLGLGTNVGDRPATLRDAIGRIGRLEDTDVIRCSSVYETEPWGFREQRDFLNAVIEIMTVLDALSLFRAVKAIERTMGRTETARNRPRPIDIDILLYGNDVMSIDALTIPHPAMDGRRFVLVPLADIIPRYVHPVERRTITELLEACEDPLGVHRTGIVL